MLICGMDEVGRASFAGPLVAAAVIPKSRVSIRQIKTVLGKELRDSKKLSKLQRRWVIEKVTPLVRWKVTAITVEEINAYGIGWANQEIFRRLARMLPAKRYVVDGNVKFGPGFETLKSKIKADDKVPQVMLASVFAKFHRDMLLAQMAKEFPVYGWERNAGYGTKFHRQAILKHGICVYHRLLFVRTTLYPKIDKSKRKRDNKGDGRSKAGTKLSA